MGGSEITPKKKNSDHFPKLIEARKKNQYINQSVMYIRNMHIYYIRVSYHLIKAPVHVDI